jgi:hypothetical protein
MPPGGMPPPPPQPAPPAGLMPPPRPAQPFSGVDIPSELPEHWGMLDAISRQLKLAITMPGFGSTPKVVAALYSILASLTKLISHYTAKGDAGGAPTSVAQDMPEPEDGSDAHFVSADADTIPPPGDES